MDPQSALPHDPDPARRAPPVPTTAAPARSGQRGAALPKPTPTAKVEAPKPVTPPVKTAQAPPTPKPAPVAKAMAPAPAKPPAPATTAPKQLAANAPSAAQAPVASGIYLLQIGAYKSQGEADAAWTVYKAKHAALLAGYSPNVAQADLGDKGVWYRLRIAGFSSKDVASALCDRLKADGGGCFLGK